MHSFRGAFCRFCREKRHADGFGAFNFATLVFLLLARIARKRSLLVLRVSVDIKSTEKSATMSRVFCTFFPQKGTQKSPADACAYFVPSNVRNGRLFAGLQANRPRFLPLLAGTSFDGSASGRNRSRRNAARSWRNSQISDTQNPAIAPGSGFKPPHSRLERNENNLQPAKATCGWFWCF